jgi:hypothetical protein
MLLAPALANMAGVAVLPGARAQVVDAATQAMRREVEAEIVKQAAIWARLRAMPPGRAFEGAAGGVRTVEDRILLADDYIGTRIFGSAMTDADRREYLGLLLAARIDRANGQRVMTAAEQRALQLAGRGDIKRFFDRVMEVCERDRGTDGVQIEFREYQAFMNELGELQATFHSGPFDAGSLYSKALYTIRTGGLAVKR